MRAEAIPEIRLTVNRMKATIVQYLGAAGSELGETMSKQIDDAIANYPWEREVKEIVHKAIHDHVENYFKWGKGHCDLRDAIEKAFENMDTPGADR